MAGAHRRFQLCAGGRIKHRETLRNAWQVNVSEGFLMGNGEGGIRTLGTEKPHTGFRNRPLQPLGHLSRWIRDCIPPCVRYPNVGTDKQANAGCWSYSLLLSVLLPESFADSSLASSPDSSSDASLESLAPADSAFAAFAASSFSCNSVAPGALKLPVCWN